MTLRPFPLVGGIVALVIGAGIVVADVSVLPTGAPRFMALVAAALVAGLIGVVDLVGRSLVETPSHSLPEDARGPAVRTPGDALDRRLQAVSPADRATERAIRERAEAVAVDVLVRRTGIDPGAARDRLRSGEWTDDPVAAALFAPEAEPASLGLRLRSLITGETAFRRRVRRATTELHRLAEDDR